jgi:hypothetical protein
MTFKHKPKPQTTNIHCFYCGTLLKDFELAMCLVSYPECSNCKRQKNKQMKTAFEYWELKQAEHGSFVTALFQLYQLADPFNKIRLNKAFPELFTEKHPQPYQAKLRHEQG